MSFWTFLTSVPKNLNFISVGSLIILILKILYLNKIKEIFSWGYELGLLIEAILSSIIASYVFYLVVVHFKEINDKKTIYPSILKWASSLVDRCERQLFDIQSILKTPMSLDSITEESIGIALQNMNPNNNSPFLSAYPDRYKTWTEYMLYHQQYSKKYANKIISQLIYVESDFISIILKIEDCAFLKHIEEINGRKLADTDMSSFSSMFYEYCKLCQALKEKIGKSKVIYG